MNDAAPVLTRLALQCGHPSRKGAQGTINLPNKSRPVYISE